MFHCRGPKVGISRWYSLPTVMDLNCLTVPSARLMFSELLEWLADPARSSLPHFEGAQFSLKGFSAAGPGRNCADALPAKASRIVLARSGSLIAISSLRLGC